jgi:hypothetical protein
MALVDFRERIGTQIPVLDGGKYRNEVLRHTGRTSPDGSLSEGLALALLRLERPDRVRLERRADFAGGSFQVGPKQITHLVFPEDA